MTTNQKYTIQILAIITFVLCIMLKESTAQKSKWDLSLGVESLITSAGLSGGVGRSYAHDTDPISNESLIFIKTKPAIGYSIGIGFNVFKWLSINQVHKYYGREYNYYFSSFDENKPGLLNKRMLSKNSLGLPATKNSLFVLSNSNQTKINISQPLDKQRLWRLFATISYNWENYEKNHYLEDTPIEFSQEYNFINENGESIERYKTRSRISLNQNNIYGTGKVASYSLGLGVIHKVVNSNYSLKLEIGRRRIIKESIIDKQTNQFNISTKHEKFDIYGKENILTHSTESNIDFPIYLDGIYANFSIVVHPFSKKDLIDKQNKNKTK